MPSLAGVDKLITDEVTAAGVGQEKAIALQDDSPVLRSSGLTTPCNKDDLDIILSTSRMYDYK